MAALAALVLAFSARSASALAAPALVDASPALVAAVEALPAAAFALTVTVFTAFCVSVRICLAAASESLAFFSLAADLVSLLLAASALSLAAAALLVAFSSSALMRSLAAASSSSVGMPVTLSRTRPQSASSSRVSVIWPVEMLVEPAGRVISARQRS